MSYIMYLDESYSKDSKYTLMIGFIIPSDNWKKINDAINILKTKYFKTQNINLKLIRTYKYNKSQSWVKLSQEEKDNFNKEFYEIICSKEHTIIASMINKEKMNSKNKNLLFQLAYSFIIQRYQYFLDNQDKKGIIVMDLAETSPEILELAKHHREYLKNGLPIRKKIKKIRDKKNLFTEDYDKLDLDNIYENLIFMDDEYNNLIQVTDMITAGINAHFNKGKNQWYNKIESMIRCSKGGEKIGFGLKFFPEK